MKDKSILFIRTHEKEIKDRVHTFRTKTSHWLMILKCTKSHFCNQNGIFPFKIKVTKVNPIDTAEDKSPNTDLSLYYNFIKRFI